MRKLIPARLCLRTVVFICAICLSGAAGLAEQLPVHAYTTADGLPRDRVTRIVQDSRGFIWLCTAEGLSRYDGYHFQNYGVTDGLPNRDVRDLKETRSGVYWIATSSGLAIFSPAYINVRPAEPKPRFVPFVLDSARKGLFISKLFLDREDAIWCATNNGVYRIEHSNGEWRPVQIDFGLGPDPRDLDVHDVIEDQQGSIWCTTDAGIHQRDGQGHQTFYSTKDGLPSAAVRALVQDREGQFWAGTDNGLCRFTIAREGKTFNVTRNYTVADGLHSNNIWSILQTSDGRLWVATGGLNLWEPASPQNRPSFRAYTSAQGLKGNSVNSLAEDSDGNVWLGTEADGAEKIIGSGLISYTTADGLSNDRIAAVFEDRNGVLRVAVSRADAMLNSFDGGRFAFSSTRLPAGARYSWGWYQTILQDRERDWWLATANGIYRYPSDRQGNPAMSTHPKAIYAKQDGLGADEVFRIFEDSRGDIWFGTLGYLDKAMGRWERTSQTLHLYTPQADGVPGDSPSAFAENQNGDIWIGFYSGGVARYRDGHFSVFKENSGLAAGFVRGLYFDSKQRLWVSTSEGGVSRSDDPAGEQPHFVTLTVADGLSSSQVTSVVEGGDGRFYIGTGRGIDQLDLGSGRIGHFTTADGLPDSFINVSYRDHAGALWFGTLHGLSRLVPGQRRQKLNSQILISGVRAGNSPYQSADLGAVNISGLELGPGENRLQVDFVSPSFAPGENLRYQYMLEGADRDWSAATDQRSLNLANLAPGRYRLLARAVNSEGKMSLQPATISFRVLPPIWRRWWFIGLMIILVGTAVFGLDRYRVARMKELRASETRFRTLAETASDAIITIDGESSIVYINAAAEKIFGYPLAEMLGADLTMLMPEYLRHVHRAGLSRYTETGRRHIAWSAVELPGLHRDGHEIPLELSFGEFTRNERRYFTGIARDITERKRSEEELRRTRETRAAELERVRKRIASDLHDDIGSSLTQISLLSEVVNQRLDRGEGAVAQPLAMIANSSRELVDAMSDIVWAINPQKDHLSDLTQRMRSLASEVSTACGINVRFRTPVVDVDLPLGANLRREVFLIFKESINNIVKHAGATEADVEFRVARDELFLRVTDNGQGFDPAQESDGHGLLSMRTRGQDIGGKFEMIAAVGKGTTVTLLVPLEETAPPA